LSKNANCFARYFVEYIFKNTKIQHWSIGSYLHMYLGKKYWGCMPVNTILIVLNKKS
jgi:hypothetical protein